MSVSPSGSPPRRALHQRSHSQNNAQNNRLGIRLVPYSPPRVASDATATSSKTITQADTNTETETELERSQTSHSSSPQFETPTPSPSLQRARAKTTALPPSSFRGSTRYSSSDYEPSQSSWAPHYDNDDNTSNASRPPSRGPSASPRPPSRKKVIKVNPDKTFSVQYHNVSMSSRVESLWSLPPSFTTGNTSYGRESVGTIGDDRQSRPTSPLTPLAEREPSSPIISSRIQDPSTPDNSSPWNYRLFGGLRKVPKTPDVKQKQPETQDVTAELSLPPLPEVDFPLSEAGPSSRWLNEKTSFHSSSSDQTRTTVSNRTNLKTYRESSPVNVADLRSLPPSSIHSNIELIGDPSSAEASLYASTRPPTEDSNVNFVTHGSHGSHSASSSIVAVRHRTQPEFSQESLVVAPLQPRKRRSSDTFALARTRSRETIRSRSASITSLSTIFTQEATRALFVGPPTILQHAGPSWQDLNRPQSRPYQWSGQLSTVMSESEGGSEPASRTLSLSSVPRRRGSDHSKHVLSMTSSLFGLEEHVESPSQSRGSTPSHSRNSSLEPPAATYARNSARDPATGTIRLVRDLDEDGDGLADLEVLHHRPSRTRMGRFLSSYASDRSLRSTASFNAAVPAWAKVYYGSGERKWLAAQPSMESMYDSDFYESDHHEPQLSRSPSQDANATNIRIPRRRPRDAFPRQHSNAGSMDISAAPAHPVLAVVRNIKKQTSSIWSPHLARDRRPFQHSIWQPPASEWEARSELTGRRNAQVTMFVVGFIFPLAWMFAAFIPIKAATKAEDVEANNCTSKSDGSKVDGKEDAVFTSAIWWRRVNRGMSIIGLLILGAIIALSVVGVKQRWGH
ncbi:hypothetical protein NXS19_003254 [Fusarium pseudograminearum]|uniref:Serine-rich protein n=1 Tax=Fusarium pseudograminearum (strain CS3096) TaxID=1028729 RepID=K3V7V8_FUSPC|nr:hypothetical protein FPSE_11932 [Fusarium pseudograminearum CS3096]EKJ67923.1 hypothetical protein FPSE_11932 [Fusarium pseudograminearum CS3096]KAF0639921.1 hypothetical protein FPSE5266_11932 [Fusarium pseudograminearum]UZP35438.1 hypothetical protein NXS19_003254 [Fusarium pseudograminearum]